MSFSYESIDLARVSHSIWLNVCVVTLSRRMAMPAMSLGVSMKMRVTPGLLHLTRLLSLPSMSLHQAIRQELDANPALEEISPSGLACRRCGGRVPNGVCLWCAGEDTAYVSRSALRQANDTTADAWLQVAAPSGVLDTLLADLYASLPQDDRPIALVLVGSLDDHGFLDEHPAAIAVRHGFALDRVEAVLRLLRELGPPGIAARTIRESMLAQIAALQAEGVVCTHVDALVDACLEDLSAHRYPSAARRLGITVAQVRAAHDFIKCHLWPYPLQGQSPSGGQAGDRSAAPDLSIVVQHGAFVVELPRSPTNTLRLNPLYQRLARTTESLAEHERVHVQAYIARARTFLANLHQRDATLLRVGAAIVARQQAFLRHGIRSLTPMTRLEIAAELDLHESTVCRAIAGKMALLPNRQLWPLSEFFVSARSVQDVLRELITTEGHAMSDQQLARVLGERGYPVARRTVTKYRDQMKILPCHLR
jgi:RNA polymerase sigma-54 factor